MNNEIKVSEVYNLKSAKNYINDVIDSNWISYTGKYVSMCEEKLKNILNVKHIVLTTNGTAATHCVMKSVKYKHPECKKIYIPDHCYVAVYNSVLMEYDKSQIEIIPTDKSTWNLDLNYIERMDQNSCLLLVHNLGNIIPIHEIKHKRPDIILVEDNCEGFMGKEQNKMAGSDTLASSISFYANKHITSAEGGAFITNDDDVYEYIKRFCTQGLTKQKYVHDILAYNYKFNNLSAALLYSQLEHLGHIYTTKKGIFDLYTKLFNDYKDLIGIQYIVPTTTHSCWMFGVSFNNHNKTYEQVEKYFKTNNIEIRPFFYSYEQHIHLKDIKSMAKSNLDKQIILLPLHCYMQQEHVKHIVEVTMQYVLHQKNNIKLIMS